MMGVVLFAALGMRAYQWVQSSLIPTADVESVSYEQMSEGEGIEGISLGNGGIEGNEVIEEGEVNTVGEEKDPDERKDPADSIHNFCM